jgi:(1->4)-alpha-D-glucan 1-alpha-D-glucosylmutase
VTRPSVVPSSTYRLQIRPGFGFDAARAVVDHLDALGVTHLYLSPILQAAPGSTHGYDVVDHKRLSTEAGGRQAFTELARALRERGMAAVADVVPNHMAVPTPVRLNEALWSVLRDGPGSPFARWFDVDWSVPSRAVLMPVLGRRIGQVIADGELTVDASGPEPVLRYYDHEFPIRPGTQDLPFTELVDQQWYRLAWWRVADEELNYRRFFDVDTLAALRTEDPEVFEATHEVLLELVAQGSLEGLRIDHPDGLADPRGYLRRLAKATNGCWVVVEKILEGDESLPPDWPCAGTTGYDALRRVGGLFVDPAGAAPLSGLLTELTGDSADFTAQVDEAKRHVVEQSLYAEVQRLVDLVADITADDIALRDFSRRQLHDAIAELLVAFDRYRAYVVPGEQAPPESVEVVEHAAREACERVPEEARDAVELVRDLVLGRPAGSGQVGGLSAARRRELVVRFQQTCGPVMAKGVEDTAFYRWHRLIALNEVGGDPSRFGVVPEEFHAYCRTMQRDWPLSMTTLSTHDTKRSEDVRARVGVLSELPQEWAELARAVDAVSQAHTTSGSPGRGTRYLLWQTLAGMWDGGPPVPERVLRYMEKATREAKRHTSWTSPDADYDAAVAAFVRAALTDDDVTAPISQFVDLCAPWARVAILGQKLVQLTMPGVPDVYQGTELVDLSLVDPDNRRDVDFDDRRARLARLDAGQPPADISDEKLLITSRTLRLRREHPEWFTGALATYSPLPTSSGNAVAFGRGEPGRTDSGRAEESGVRVVAVATRLPVALERHGGWGEHTLSVPEGSWRDVLGMHEVEGGNVGLADLLDQLPVALLVRA